MSARAVQLDVRSWSCLMVMCLAWTLDGHAAEQETQPIELELRITAQPLDEALQEFARQSGLQVIYFSSLAAGIQSPGVSGKYTVRDALNALLAGSGLTFRLVNARTVAIRKSGARELPRNP